MIILVSHRHNIRIEMLLNWRIPVIKFWDHYHLTAGDTLEINANTAIKKMEELNKPINWSPQAYSNKSQHEVRIVTLLKRRVLFENFRALSTQTHKRWNSSSKLHHNVASIGPTRECKGISFPNESAYRHRIYWNKMYRKDYYRPLPELLLPLPEFLLLFVSPLVLEAFLFW